MTDVQPANNQRNTNQCKIIKMGQIYKLHSYRVLTKMWEMSIFKHGW